VAQLYPQSLGSFFVASYDSQGYGGGIRTRLHMAEMITVKIRVYLRLEVYRQSIRLVDKPLETHDQRLFFKLNPCAHSPYVTSSLMRRRGCLL
jgi:hypothetical protein